ncbi:MmcQ/YjbR family DNA-binding protein [Kribbella antiqua]|nr:MmcQ/YjbR family DNA-binding protein [Kribbella antiqua]
MATWEDVGRIALGLPDATIGQAHEGSPAYDVAGKQFARLRWDEGREIMQFWAGDAREALVNSNPNAYWVVKAFPSALFAWLDQVDPEELHEIVTDSWRVRAPQRLLKANPDLS